MDLTPEAIEVLRAPSASAVWQLRAELLGGGMDPTAGVFDLLAEFHRFLDHIETGSASRDHSERASLMEVGSLSGVVVSDLAEASDAAEWARRLLSAVLTEGLAVMATRQHVRAWRGELASVYRDAAWCLYHRLWTWAERRKPELEPGQRRSLLDQLMAPVLNDAADSQQQATLVTSLFLLLLVDALAET